MKRSMCLMRKISGLLNTFDFPTEDKKETQKKFWKRIISKSFMTRRELYVLHGFFKRLRRKIRF